MIDLFMTLDAVDQGLANVAEMLTVERPDLTPNAGMDLGGPAGADLVVGRSAVPRQHEPACNSQGNPGNSRPSHLPGHPASLPCPH